MSRSDFWAAERHFVDHLAPVWHALPENRRGSFWTKPSLVAHARSRNIDARAADGTPRALLSGTGPVVTAAWGQARRVLRSSRPVVLLNHGSGQTFVDVSHPSYSGGSPEVRRMLALFLEPGPHAAEATLASIPSARVAQIGSPKMDVWHTRPSKPRNARPVVAVSFHWHCDVCPETGSAVDYFRPVLAELAAQYEVIGHGHPKEWDEFRTMWETLGVEPVADFEEVLERADLYVADGTSTLYEFASTGRPVLCLNAPEYRRDVNHGLRFWDAVPGLECDRPQDLASMVAVALQDPPEARQRRAHGVARAYVACDGQAAHRAAEAIVQLADECASETVAITANGRTVTVSRKTWQLVTEGVEITDGNGYRMLVRHTDYMNRWAANGWRISDDA